MAVFAALSAALSAIGVAYSTPRPDMLYTSSRPLSPAPLPEFRRTDADLFEGVHSEVSQPLTQRVLERGMPRSDRTPQWHTAPAATAHAAQPTRHRAPVHRAPVPPGLTARHRRVQLRRRVPPAARLTWPVHPASACMGSSAMPHPAATPRPGSCAQLTLAPHPARSAGAGASQGVVRPPAARVQRARAHDPGGEAAHDARRALPPAAAAHARRWARVSVRATVRLRARARPTPTPRPRPTPTPRPRPRPKPKPKPNPPQH